jgi:Helix-turn-helix domain
MSSRPFVKVDKRLLCHASRLGLDDGLLRLLLCLMSFDWGNGNVWPAQDTLADCCDTSVKTVQRRSQKLIALRLVERSRPHPRGRWHYDLSPLRARLDDFEATEPRRLESTARSDRAMSPRGGDSRRQSDAFEATEGAVRGDRAASTDVDAVKTKTQADTDPHTPRRDVCEGELASKVLAHFNERTLASYDGSSWLHMIRARIAEHPELTFDHHRVIIERNFAQPWWKGDPSPSVLYKDREAFERAMNKHGRAPQYETRAERKERRTRQRLASIAASEAARQADVIEGTAVEITGEESQDDSAAVAEPQPEPEPESEHEQPMSRRAFLEAKERIGWITPRGMAELKRLRAEDEEADR